jgi:hypothetical protein
MKLMKKNINFQEFGVDLALFMQWRTPRYGESNPTRMDNKVWEWLIKSKISAYQANEKIKSDISPFGDGATWCFDRFGQSETQLPDGRTVFIAGEHEDDYDPDFYIYNDVVVINSDESVEIYGYPESVFPPTDFHSATLVNNTIVIIGSLSYPEKRIMGQTPVYLLDLSDFSISKVNTSGISLGWLYEHTATLSKDQKHITIGKGTIARGEKLPWAENIDVWQLNLTDWSWQRLTDRKWVRWEMRRADHKRNYFWEIGHTLWKRKVNWQEEYQRDINKLIAELGKEPDFEVFKNLYKPNIPHKQLPENENEHRVQRIKVDGVIVRYVEDSHFVQVTVEGELPETVIDKLKADLLEKFSLLENTDCYIEDI